MDGYLDFQYLGDGVVYARDAMVNMIVDVAEFWN